jgi:predicted alpha/beta-fold hydrolase
MLVNSLVLLIVVLVVVFIIRRSFVKIGPVIYANSAGSMATIIARMGSLHQLYLPTPWLPGGHLQTMWGMRLRRSHAKCRRTIFTFSDGGTCGLDFFDPPESAAPPPVLIIYHTLGGGTREPCTSNLAHRASQNGIRAVVMNMRGCSGVKFSSARFYSCDSIGDSQKVIRRVWGTCNPPFVFLCGFSFGAYLAMAYCVGEGAVDGLICISHTYDIVAQERKFSEFIQRHVYLPFMLAKLKAVIRKNQCADYQKAQDARTLREFDQAVICVNSDWDPAKFDDYYAAGRLSQTIARVKAPTLAFGADKDPMLDPNCAPVAEATASDNAAVVRISEGGHVSFPIGWRAADSLADIVAIDFCRAIMAVKASANE